MFTTIMRRGTITRRPASATLLARLHATLRAALNAAVRENLLPDNPSGYIELPRLRRPHAVVWTSDQIAEWQRSGTRPRVAIWTAAQTATFLTAISGHRLYAVYHLITLRGLRRGEAAGLRWCDLDLDAALITINSQTQRLDGGGLAQCPPKTPTSRRTIALDRTTVTALRRHRDLQQAELAPPRRRRRWLRLHHPTRPADDPRCPDPDLRRHDPGERASTHSPVESARGAVLVLPPARFPGPLAEPAVPISR
ncbi:hypothetical protein [Nonomuraea insulae]|uniref:Tyr recombinase domain-containing protein n=1 Tax=Nonomuraea insulae TaxID=1616787 RepID=A0ABW1CH05_9ACTN